MLRLVITFPLVFSALGTAQAEELTGWEKFIANEPRKRELAKAPDVSLKETKGQNVFVEVKNRTGFDLTYYGVRKHRPQLFSKIKKGGKWVPAGWDWCGTGMRSHRLSDKASVVFELFHDGKEDVQIFAVFNDAKDFWVFSVVKLYEKETHERLRDR